MLRKARWAGVAAALGVPAALWQSDNIRHYAGWPESTASPQAHAELDAIAPQPTAFSSEGVTAYDPTRSSSQAALPLERSVNLPPVAGPTVELSDVLRLDVTRQWVTQHWGRVTTSVADLNYDGIRVALVSGTSPGDLCGALTYYFDNTGQAQRIAFHGAVGDPQRLSETLTDKLGFRRQSSLGGEFYTRSYFGNTTGICRIRPAAVMHASSPLTHYEVILEINRPAFSTELSEAAKRLLAS